MSLKVLLLLSLLLLVSPDALSRQPVVLATLEWEPYVGQSLPGQGSSAGIVREAFRRSGYTLELRFLPWARVVETARRGEVHGYFPEYRDEALQADFVFSDPMPGGPLGFFARKDSGIVFRTLEDLKPHLIGVVRGYVNTREFDQAAFLRKDEATDDLTNLRKLVAGRNQLMVADKYVGLHLAARHLPGQAGEIEFLDPPLEEKELFVCFPRSRPDHRELVEALNRGLRSMREDGHLARFTRALGLPAAPPAEAPDAGQGASPAAP